MAKNKGLLAATSGLAVSELSKARVQPGSALWQRLLQLAVPSCDALDAARAASVLITLAGDSFVAALGLAGVSILRADLVPRIKEGEDLGWLRHIIGLAEDNEAGACCWLLQRRCARPVASTLCLLGENAVCPCLALLSK